MLSFLSSLTKVIDQGEANNFVLVTQHDCDLTNPRLLAEFHEFLFCPLLVTC